MNIAAIIFIKEQVNTDVAEYKTYFHDCENLISFAIYGSENFWSFNDGCVLEITIIFAIFFCYLLYDEDRNTWWTRPSLNLSKAAIAIGGQTYMPTIT